MELSVEPNLQPNLIVGQFQTNTRQSHNNLSTDNQMRAIALPLGSLILFGGSHPSLREILIVLILTLDV